MFRKTGPWGQVQKILDRLSVKLYPSFQARIMESGELYLQTVLGHIDAQNLSWTPLSERTIELKGGDTTIYVETGWLYNNLAVEKIKSNKTEFAIFVGASKTKVTPKGERFSDLMIWLEYGTDKMPPRPLLRPSWTEVEPLIKETLSSGLVNIITNL